MKNARKQYLMKIWNFLACFTLIGVTANLAQAQESKTSTTDGAEDRAYIGWYRAEVILFENLNTEAYTIDIPHEPLSQPRNTALRHLVHGSSMTDFQVHRLPEKNLTLYQTYQRLKNSRDYRPILIAGWNDFLPPGTHKLPLQIQGGEQVGDHYEYEGTLTIERARYLHVKADIDFIEYELREKPPAQQSWAQLQDNQTSISDWLATPLPSDQTGLWSNRNRQSPDRAESSTTISPSAEQRTTSQSPPSPQSNISPSEIEGPNMAYVPARVYAMSELRRMRSRETHFFDHPLFGLLVRFEPIIVEPRNTPADPVEVITTPADLTEGVAPGTAPGTEVESSIQ
ncbi:5'-methylthioadenosine phosphorylase [Oleiphilus messinensis]|uniref:5'-methylthioadenosine phosphorylase n=1 Tax=Oleiphilus messinensis TaxID=141451 RepID=A0A1Y0I8T2_9GAMM|nr:CsiV family protein [Oleiphilus messinensis]ARU56650.1 5'-methylthioadenosine phosphorylase [Oleiphilus messinensis]